MSSNRAPGESVPDMPDSKMMALNIRFEKVTAPMMTFFGNLKF